MTEARFLRDTVSPQPLIHRWYAWPQMISPVSCGFNLRDRQLPILDSYLESPHLHRDALSNPIRMAGPFLDPGPSGQAEVLEFAAGVRAAVAPLLELARDVDRIRDILKTQADGRALTDLYASVPASLRGLVELVYDDQQQPSMRFFEALVYRSELYPRAAQQISLLAEPDLGQPFIFNSPLLPSGRRLDVTVPFDSPVLDDLYATRVRGGCVEELAERLAVPADRLAEYFTDQPPVDPLPAPAAGVRMRYLGHAGILLESATSTVLLDPMVGYAGDGIEHLRITDLPHRIDAIVLSHAHADHVSIETLLQLRHRTGVVVVPGGSGGTVLDPGLAPMLKALGFRNVVAMGDMDTHVVSADLSVTAVPFLGEHADLDIRAKMVPFVEIGGRRFLFATDTVVIEPELYRRITDQVGGVDALFIGLECVGAPMSWLYGPLLGTRVRRDYDRTRRLAGSDADSADQLARLTGAGRVFTYAMGFEPWLRHLTGSMFDPASEQVSQVRKLDDLCAARGVPSQMLYLTGQQEWT